LRPEHTFELKSETIMEPVFQDTPIDDGVRLLTGLLVVNFLLCFKVWGIGGSVVLRGERY